MNFPLCILLLVYWSQIGGIPGAAAESRDRKDNVDKASNMEENFIALVPDQSTVDAVNDEMRSNEISINPIATLVFQSEYPETLDGGDYIRNVSKSTPNRGTPKTPKSLTSQEAEGWSTAGKGRAWGSLAKQRYRTKTHRAKKHRHHHHRDNRDFLRNRMVAKKSRMNYGDDESQIRRPFEEHRGDKWSNFVRLQNELQMDEDLPPYMKKINRRTKQLRLLMEATVPPRRHRAPHRHRVENKFFEENIFDSQRPTVKKFSARKAPGTSFLGNSFPGEEESGEEAAADVPSVVKTATRAGNFIYHRIPSAKPSSGPTFGRVIRKQGLPFVAITDRRAKVHT